MKNISIKNKNKLLQYIIDNDLSYTLEEFYEDNSISYKIKNNELVYYDSLLDKYTLISKDSCMYQDIMNNLDENTNKVINHFYNIYENETSLKQINIKIDLLLKYNIFT